MKSTEILKNMNNETIKNLLIHLGFDFDSFVKSDYFNGIKIKTYKQLKNNLNRNESIEHIIDIDTFDIMSASTISTDLDGDTYSQNYRNYIYENADKLFELTQKYREFVNQSGLINQYPNFNSDAESHDIIKLKILVSQLENELTQKTSEKHSLDLSIEELKKLIETQKEIIKKYETTHKSNQSQMQ